MKAEVKGKNLVITIPLEDDPPLSSSGKTRVAASSGGFKDLEAKHPKTGKPLKGSYNITIPKD